MQRLTRKFIQVLRTWYLSRKLGGAKKGLRIGKNVTLRNPHCLYFGRNVGIGDNAIFLPCQRYAGETYSPRIVIGDGCWIGKHNSFASIHGIEIGNDVLFAGYVHITDHSHGYEDIQVPVSKQKLTSKGAIVIEDQCWLGFGCEILSGVHIGRHSVVAARAVVTKDVPAYSVVAGNPARVVKQYNDATNRWEKVK